MKKVITFLCMGCLIASVFMSCETTESSSTSSNPMAIAKSVKKPDVIDHKNEKYGKGMPEWVGEEAIDIEKTGKYGDTYIFVFESEKAEDLEGAQVWLSNFSAAREIVRQISQRVSDKAASAVAGNKNALGGYTKELVKIVSEATVTGFKKESDYWVQRRYYTPEGEVEGDFYTVLALYSIPKAILDEILREALKAASGRVPPKTPEEQEAYDEVQRAFEEGF